MSHPPTASAAGAATDRAAADTVDLRLCPGLPLAPAATIRHGNPPTAPGTADDAPAPVFAEPWQAQAFAMTLALHARGLFTWAEWAQALGRQIRAAQAAGDPDLGDTYYQHWLAALEALVVEKGAGNADELDRTAQAWARAAERTPHGQPIVLRAADHAG